MTTKLQQAAKLMDVKLLDHIIVAKGRYYSMFQHGHLLGGSDA